MSPYLLDVITDFLLCSIFYNNNSTKTIAKLKKKYKKTIALILQYRDVTTW